MDSGMLPYLSLFHRIDMVPLKFHQSVNFHHLKINLQRWSTMINLLITLHLIRKPLNFQFRTYGIESEMLKSHWFIHIASVRDRVGFYSFSLFLSDLLFFLSFFLRTSDPFLMFNFKVLNSFTICAHDMIFALFLWLQVVYLIFQ